MAFGLSHSAAFVLGFGITLGLYNSVAIVLGFSFFVVFLDEYVVKPWRHRKWERKAASGDKHAEEMLRMARSAKVSEE
jgi:hypothetical protein